MVGCFLVIVKNERRFWFIGLIKREIFNYLVFFGFEFLTLGDLVDLSYLMSFRLVGEDIILFNVWGVEKVI